jgi:choline-glycine betaine transporter
LTEEISFHWSLIVFVCLVPIAAILFYIHYRLNRGIELRRFFHI